MTINVVVKYRWDIKNCEFLLILEMIQVTVDR